MNITSSESIGPATVLGVGLTAGGEWDPAAAELVASIEEGLIAFLEQSDMTGKPGQAVMYPAANGVDYVVVLGLGDDPDAESLRQAAGTLSRMTPKAPTVATTLASRDISAASRAVTEGLLLGRYRFDRYVSESQERLTESVTLVGGEDAAISAGRAVAEAVVWARDLINTPAADKSPEDVVAGALEALADQPIRSVVYQGSELEEQRFGGLMGVAAGSSRPARMLELWYEPVEAQAFLALVGKGITFDSGGLSLKPASGMEMMKTDMSGAAAVLGALAAIVRLEIPVKVLALSPLSDNMPSGSATKPGDVLTARNGKTIEVVNTDAEGRLVLADALSLASEHGPDLIIDVATLTGACKVALGEKIAGGFSTDEQALDRVVVAGSRVGERIWPLPLPDDYRKLIDSPIADMSNSGGRFGAAITAALLLREFVEGCPWVHLDIAGPARWPEDEHYQSKGGSGFGVRTLVALAEDIASNGGL